LPVGDVVRGDAQGRINSVITDIRYALALAIHGDKVADALHRILVCGNTEKL